MSDETLTIREPMPDLDSLVKEWDERIASPPPEQSPEPAGPSPTDRLASIQALWTAAETWREGLHRQLEEIQPVLDEQVKAEERAALDAQIAAIKANHDLEHIPAEAIAAVIHGGNAQTLAALRQVNDEINSRRSRDDIERAVLATRNSSTSAPPAPHFDAKAAVAMNDQQWEKYKAQYLAETGRTR